jgi:AcrR family transcriptional regulator
MVSGIGSTPEDVQCSLTDTVLQQTVFVSSTFPDMNAPTRRRSVRDRLAKLPLSEEAIVDAALAITRAEGLHSVTMRRVAAELETGAASLYVYFPNRDELLRAMMDRVAGTVSLAAPEPERWREQVFDLTQGLLDALEAYPGMASVLLGEAPTTENTLAGAENLLGILLAGGIPSQDASWAVDILMLIVTATATETDIRRAAGKTTSADRDDAVARIRATFAGLPPSRFPQLVSHASELVAGAGDERFRFAVGIFLDGLAARAARA